MKENHEIGQGIFIPRQIIDLPVKWACKGLLAYVWWFEKQKSGCFVSSAWLAAALDVSETRVSHMILDLEKKGFLKKWFAPDRRRHMKVVIPDIVETDNACQNRQVPVVESDKCQLSKVTNYKIEYEIDDEINTCRAIARPDKYSVDTYKAIEDAFGESYKQRTGKEYKNTNIPAGRKALKNLLQSGADPDTIADMARAYVEQADGKYRPYTLLAFVKHYNDIQASVPKSMKQVAKELSRHKPLEMREEKLIFLEEGKDEML